MVDSTNSVYLRSFRLEIIFLTGGEALSQDLWTGGASHPTTTVINGLNIEEEEEKKETGSETQKCWWKKSTRVQGYKGLFFCSFCAGISLTFKRFRPLNGIHSVNYKGLGIKRLPPPLTPMNRLLFFFFLSNHWGINKISRVNSHEKKNISLGQSVKREAFLSERKG